MGFLLINSCLVKEKVDERQIGTLIHNRDMFFQILLKFFFFYLVNHTLTSLQLSKDLFFIFCPVNY